MSIHEQLQKVDDEILEKRINSLPENKTLTEDEAFDITDGLGCNSYNRLDAFIRISPRLKGKTYWKVLSGAYQGSDNLFKYKSQIKGLFESSEPGREFLMNAEEREYLKQLPETVKIYRGMTDIEEKNKSFGVSWTLSKQVAEYFAYTYGRNHDTRGTAKTVKEMTVPKNKIIAYFNGRNEDEIIYIT